MLTLQEREAIARSPAWKLSLSPVESQDAFSSGKASGQCFISNSAMSKLASPPLRCTGPWPLRCQIRSRSSKASSWAISSGTPVSFFAVPTFSYFSPRGIALFPFCSNRASAMRQGESDNFQQSSKRNLSWLISVPILDFATAATFLASSSRGSLGLMGSSTHNLPIQKPPIEQRLFRKELMQLGLFFSPLCVQNLELPVEKLIQISST